MGTLDKPTQAVKRQYTKAKSFVGKDLADLTLNVNTWLEKSEYPDVKSVGFSGTNKGECIAIVFYESFDLKTSSGSLSSMGSSSP